MESSISYIKPHFFGCCSDSMQVNSGSITEPRAEPSCFRLASISRHPAHTSLVLWCSPAGPPLPTASASAAPVQLSAMVIYASAECCSSACLRCVSSFLSARMCAVPMSVVCFFFFILFVLLICRSAVIKSHIYVNSYHFCLSVNRSSHEASLTSDVNISGACGRDTQTNKQANI